MNDSPGHIVESADEALEILRSARTVAVLGIKPEDHGAAPAFFVPQYLQRAGYDVIPVPVYYPEVTEILGVPIHRTLASIDRSLDLVVVFRRPRDLPPHLPDIIAARPAAVWLQSGIRHPDFARALADEGIRVVQDRCTMVDHQRIR